MRQSKFNDKQALKHYLKVGRKHHIFFCKRRMVGKDFRAELKRLFEKYNEIKGLLSRAGETTSDLVARVYEERVEKLSNQKLLLKEKIARVEHPSVNFETALDETFEYLKYPYAKWDRGDINDKRLVLKLVFAEKLVYDREKGFETAILVLPLRVFELNAVSKFQLVETVEVEST